MFEAMFSSRTSLVVWKMIKSLKEMIIDDSMFVFLLFVVKRLCSSQQLFESCAKMMQVYFDRCSKMLQVFSFKALASY